MVMTDRSREKRDWERQAIRLFIGLYNREFPGAGYRLLYQQERPDSVLEEKGGLRRKLGVEITHLFSSQEEAMRVLNHGRPPAAVGPGDFDVLLRELNLLIRKKVGKRDSYSMDYPIALLIRNASPGFGMEDFLARRDEVVLPEGVFSHIWFLSKDSGGNWRLLELV
ncbi:hypothetical protein [Gorillibacterium sp. sgz5001074]|uniref:hypothetical protein n=1 Tax=Gorillibacterium sp. sgz5001074 TaxID=3446695 RepID=UPI003F680050